MNSLDNASVSIKASCVHNDDDAGDDDEEEDEGVGDDEEEGDDGVGDDDEEGDGGDDDDCDSQFAPKQVAAQRTSTHSARIVIIQITTRDKTTQGRTYSASFGTMSAYKSQSIVDSATR